MQGKPACRFSNFPERGAVSLRPIHKTGIELHKIL